MCDGNFHLWSCADIGVPLALIKVPRVCSSALLFPVLTLTLTTSATLRPRLLQVGGGRGRATSAVLISVPARCDLISPCYSLSLNISPCYFPYALSLDEYQPLLLHVLPRLILQHGFKTKFSILLRRLDVWQNVGGL